MTESNSNRFSCPHSKQRVVRHRSSYVSLVISHHVIARSSAHLASLKKQRCLACFFRVDCLLFGFCCCFVEVRLLVARSYAELLGQHHHHCVAQIALPGHGN